MPSNVELTIVRRFAELVSAGDALVQMFPTNNTIDTPHRAGCLSWMLSAVNLLEVALPSDSRHRREAVRLLPSPDSNIWPDRLATILGILKSAADEWRNDLISTLEPKFVGLAFEDFLRHTAVYNQEGKKMEAAVLASAVLEDTVKRLCRKHDIDLDDKGLVHHMIEGLEELIETHFG